jgi:hypothetical protein
VHVPVETTDSLAPTVRPSSSKANDPRLAPELSTSHREAPEDSLVAMDQGGDGDDDLLREDKVYYEVLQKHIGKEVNVVTFSTNYTIIGDDEHVVAQFDFGPKEMIFTKPKESINHLKPLFLCGHIDGTPISMILIDGGEVVNLLP